MTLASGVTIADVWVVVAVLAFFGLCVLFVRGCDLIIGDDDDVAIEEVDESADDSVLEGAAR